MGAGVRLALCLSGRCVSWDHRLHVHLLDSVGDPAEERVTEAGSVRTITVVAS